MRRREFITLLGGAAALAARGAGAAAGDAGDRISQSAVARCTAQHLRGIPQGLNETGYVEGQNVAIEYRWAEGQSIGCRRWRPTGPPPGRRDRRDRRHVGVGGQGGDHDDPDRLHVGDDPVRLGLVASLTGRAATSRDQFSRELEAKRLELLRELVPQAARDGVLVNPANATMPRRTLRDWKRRLAPSGCNSMFSTPAPNGDRCGLRHARARAAPMRLFVGPIASSTAGASIGRLAARHASRRSTLREFAEAGGLMSYGASSPDAYRQVGVYAGRILKGEKPADLPVVQPTKFELVINLKTAKALGLDVPPTLLARADEVIE